MRLTRRGKGFTAVKEEPELTLMQEAFVLHYLGEANFNATKAALLAGYSPKAANRAGFSLLEKEHIKRRIDKEREARANRLRLTADAVLNKIASVGNYDPRKMFDDNGSMLPLKSLGNDEAAAIQGFEVTEIRNSDGEVIGVSKKVRLADRMPALDKLARHMGLLKDRVEVSGDESNPIRLLVQQAQNRSTISPVAELEHDGGPV